jgi:hypothetical protein
LKIRISVIIATAITVLSSIRPFPPDTKGSRYSWIVVDDSDQTRVIVRSGEATVAKDEGESRIRGGEQAVIGEGVSVRS